MNTTEWIILILLIQFIHGLGTFKLYEKAGRKSWEAFIPIYNAIIWMKIIHKPTWWTFLLFLPVINLIMFPATWVSSLAAFKKPGMKDEAKETLLTIFTLGFYLYTFNFNPQTEYIAEPKKNTKETAFSSILFAIVVATFVHTYFIQPFTIPSSSLEKSLLIGDFLFVSKVNYGPRVPMTTVAAPMVHDTLPFIKTKSYLYSDNDTTSWKNKLQLPYMRIPGFEKIKNNDIVVFNWPRDTLYHMYLEADRRYDKPIDKKTNYVKRCVAIPGDKMQIIDGFVYINDKKLELPERAKPQYNYTIYSKKGISGSLLSDVGSTEFFRTYKIQFYNETEVNAVRPFLVADLQESNTKGFYLAYTTSNGIPDEIIKKYNLSVEEVIENKMMATLTFDAVDKLKQNKSVDSVIRVIKKGREHGIFPDQSHDGADETKYAWSGDNYGPITIPQAGKTVSLTIDNLPLYKILIREYEHNKLEVKGNDIYINGKKATSYTFQQNYYWMMGDNRHNSLDARYFGFTPENHIVGKPVFIWMSWDSNGKGILNKIRWERLFTTVSGEGQPKSYFKYFLVFLALYFVGEYFWKKNKKNKSE
ncbi:signal peptidase I [Flavobacterium croceum DSM 17960]|uniref:Signal peptidase I n=1 Tax=Flavobacterium croceum DSM 17960 TaxID=1121886 RepID=A0A2S4N6R7_9FLAO|nr:signal peptidase I [Flavobacterium croceum]POS01408.1 signal peptidase I [Flavobacterium croceum DSM 17960]